jgi:DNA-binding GntR family transcriptional regulator
MAPPRFLPAAGLIQDPRILDQSAPACEELVKIGSNFVSTTRDRRATLPKPTAAAVVHAQLRQAILMAAIAPGEWLRQEELAASLSVSRMPVREALHLLSEEGLVEQIPHRGARVLPLSVEELEEIYAARMGLEGLAASYAAQRVDDATLNDLRRRLPHLAALSAAGQPDAYLAEDRAFMERFFAASARPRLCRQVASLRERAERYLRLVFESADHMHWLDYSYRLFQASAARDGAAAEGISQEALRWTLTHARPLIASHLAARVASD